MEAKKQDDHTPPAMSGADFILWNDHDGNGKDSRYIGTQGQTGIADTNSLETAGDTWVIIFDIDNYDPNSTGDYKKISPNTYIYSLNDTNKSSGGDWKNQIKSFILYKHQPTWWTWADRPTADQLFELNDGQALFTKDDNFLGDNATFKAPFNAEDLHYFFYVGGNRSQMNTSINCIRTGNNAWLIVFDDTDGKGNFLKIGPNSKNNDLGNLRDKIKSFLLYDTKPEFWDTIYSRPYINLGTLAVQFPGSSLSGGDTIVYNVADSTYNIKLPSLDMQSTTNTVDNDYEEDDYTKLPTNGWTKYNAEFTHNNTGGFNDKVNFSMYFNNNGKLASIQKFTWSDGSAYQIPQQLITIVDDDAWVLGTAGVPETLGISEEAASEFVDDFNFVCNTFNDIFGFIFKKSDNGGQYYFLPVTCHAINRICTNVLNNYTNRTVYTNTQDPRRTYLLSFDYASFLTNLKSEVSAQSTLSWVLKSGLAHQHIPFDNVVEYNYENLPFRTWYQEYSLSTQLGMLISCKIDNVIGSDKDDHVILMMGFVIPINNTDPPVLNFAQAIVQFTNESDSSSNIKTSQCTTTTGNQNDIINDICNQLNTGLANVNKTDENIGRQYITNVVEANMNAIINSVKFINVEY